jgi:hypothetical protein
LRMALKINCLFAITAGPKSRVPFGKVGFSIRAQIRKINWQWATGKGQFAISNRQ